MSDNHRFWNLTMPEPNSGCIIWMGANSAGYGKFMVGSRTDGTRRSVRASRYSYQLAHGHIPHGMGVLHKCDNKSCVNPDHLYAGTHSQNMQDAWDRGQKVMHNQCGEKNGTAKISEATARAIKSSKATGVECAAHYGVSRAAVSLIRSGKRWAHI